MRQSVNCKFVNTLSMSIDDSSESFVRSSGPGGQNVNKVATAVNCGPGSCPLPADVKARRALAGSKLTADDVILIDSREHRSQARTGSSAGAAGALLARSRRRPPAAQDAADEGIERPGSRRSGDGQEPTSPANALRRLRPR
jgi:ribosome-associated protein